MKVVHFAQWCRVDKWRSTFALCRRDQLEFRLRILETKAHTHVDGHHQFLRNRMPHGCFSNFSRHAIEVDGRTWETAEHFFQASKFTDHGDVEAIRNAKAPFIAAQPGRERGRSLRADWDEVRDGLMLTALRAKFTQQATIGAVSGEGAQGPRTGSQFPRARRAAIASGPDGRLVARHSLHSRSAVCARQAARSCPGFAIPDLLRSARAEATRAAQIEGLSAWRSGANLSAGLTTERAGPALMAGTRAPDSFPRRCP
jgi:predicted NAD-dependent protein-ADP-ribosyltransferase YbiA (DUF1768 family)